MRMIQTLSLKSVRMRKNTTTQWQNENIHLYKWKVCQRLAQKDIKQLVLDSPLKKMRHNAIRGPWERSLQLGNTVPSEFKPSESEDKTSPQRKSKHRFKGPRPSWIDTATPFDSYAHCPIATDPHREKKVENFHRFILKQHRLYQYIIITSSHRKYG